MENDRRTDMNKGHYWGKKGVADIIAEIPGIDQSIQTESNHVYFYKNVSSESVLDLNKILQQKTNELLKASMDIGNGRPTIYLHINSFGGGVFDGLAAMDTIIRLKKKIDIITVVEGACASAGTFISLVGTKRVMNNNSYMLIHQLSSDFWGKYRDMKDEMKNNDELMGMIKSIYSTYTKVPMKNIEEILEHDIWWNSKKCLKHGLVDEIWS
jgi:ATP-dependent protease ClpP protease subunit